MSWMLTSKITTAFPLQTIFRKDSKRIAKQKFLKQRLSSSSTLDTNNDPGTEFPEWSYGDREFFRFEILHESKISRARVGRIHTPHGIVDTPGFVAVATNAALKGLEFRDADASGQQLVFANTYHLLLQPGADVIGEAGGIHRFVNRDGPFITDSGGFQIFSLAYGSVYDELQSKGEQPQPPGGEIKKRSKKKHHDSSQNPSLLKVTEEGVLFRSYRDGRKILLTPESTIQAQKQIGADIIIPLDQLPPYHIDRRKLVESVDLTHRWEARSLREHLKSVQNQAMYAVIHGGLDVELRTKSVEYLTSLPFDGYSIGGSLGKNHDDLMQLLSWMMPLFETSSRVKNKPRHLLGIADETNILGSVPHGIDTLDSCYPTRVSRHGTLMTSTGKIHIKQGKYSRQFGVKLDETCSCKTCQRYDRAYLCHLFKANEPLFVQLATQHNIHYMHELMGRIRQDILDGKI